MTSLQDISSVTEQRICPPPRISVACENCRRKKLRCIASDTPGLCRRCLGTSSICITAAVRPKWNHRQTAAKIAPKKAFEIERSDDILEDVLKSVEISTPDHGDPIHLQGFHSSMLDFAFPEADGCTEDTIPSTAAGFNQLKLPEKAESLSKFEYREAEKMLRRFEKSNHRFPFVVLPTSWTLNMMLKERPFLTLGIFSVMSNTNLTLQRYLVQQFRKGISERLLVNGEKSLDLLQGLLVHLAWFPLYLNPRYTQLYQLLHAAVAMATELGYDAPLVPLPGVNLDIKLACLGCYYISSIYTLPPRRLSSMPFRAILARYVGEVAEASLSEMNTLRIQLVSLHQISEEAFVKLYENPHALVADYDKLQLRYRILSGTASTIQIHENLALAQKFTEMRIATLHTICDLTRETLSESLETAIAATNSALEAFIGADLQLYQDFSNIEWTRLIHVVINVFRLLSVALAHPTEDSTAHQLAQFASHFERLTIRMKDGISNNDKSKRDPNMFLLFDSVLPIIRTKYNKMISKLMAMNDFYKVPGGPPSSLASLCPVFNGSIKNTEYWDALIDANTDNFNLTEGISFEDESWINQLGAFEDLSSFQTQNNNESYI